MAGRLLWSMLLCSTLRHLTILANAKPEEDEHNRERRQADSYDALYDFTNNIIKNTPGVSIWSPFTGSGCSTRGVLKLSVSPDDIAKKRILVDMFFNNTEGWVFDLGDSETNNGWAGDAMSQGRDAELQLLNEYMSGYLSDFGPSGTAFSILKPSTTRLTVLIGDEHSVWIPDGDATRVNYYANPGWFALRGQQESEGPINYDLYLATNGVVTMSPNHLGSGLCKVGIKYVPAIENSAND